MDTVLYMRMSTDKQENSIDSQREILFRYAKKNKMDISSEYIDEGISGRQASRRPSFLQMIEDSGKGLFQAVLVYDSSRFARNLEESIVYKSTLKKNGVQLISVTEPTLDDDTTLISDAMLGAINEMYSRKLSKAVTRGMTYRAQQGYHVTPAPFGYSNCESVLVAIDNEAAIVRKIYDIYLETPSYHSIAVKLNESGIPKRNNSKWSSTDIKRILLNHSYAGLIYYNSQLYQGKHIPIIDKESFDKVRAIINQKSAKRTRPSLTYKHWLSGLIRCSHCGNRMNHVTDSKGGKSYRCGGHSNGRCMYSNFISVRKMEALIFSALNSLAASTELRNYEYFVMTKKHDVNTENLKTSLKKINARIRRIEEAYENGIDTIQEYANKKRKAVKEREDAQKNLDKLTITAQSTEARIDLLKEQAANVICLLQSESDSIERKSFALKSLIDKIILNKYTGEIKVYYFL